MGRIKTTQIKRRSLELFRTHKDELKSTFEENKPVVEKFMVIKSKKFRNVLVGYVTRLVKKQESM